MAKPIPPRWKPCSPPSCPTARAGSTSPSGTAFAASRSRDGDEVTLTSKSGKPLARYFPEVVAMLAGLKSRQFLLDGELIIPAGDVLSFDALQLRLHPAESRVRKLAAETPAQLMAFDLLELGGKPLAQLPLSERRDRLEQFFRDNHADGLLLSPMTCDRDVAVGWLERSGGALDGVIAKRADQEYRSGERAMIKVKQQRTADCVVGGFRYAEKKREVGSLLLGLYDDEGKLDHVGFTSAIPSAERPAADQEAREADCAARVHRQRSRRSEPVEHCPIDGLGAAQARAGGRGPLRPGDRPPFPPRHRLPSLASRQGPEAVHLPAACPGAAAFRTGGIVRPMTLLFDAPLIEGLNYQEELISAAEERSLLARLEPLELAPFRFHGWLGNRKTQSFGWRYDFDDASFTPGEPMPDWLLPIRDQARRFRRCPAERFRPRARRPLRPWSGHRLAPRSRRVRAGGGHFARRPCDAALPPPRRHRVQA